jgi:uncharacterized membrane protein YphA (DoxX/SURF4 family)
VHRHYDRAHAFLLRVARAATLRRRHHQQRHHALRHRGGTFGELAFPPLLALGLASRFAALSLTFVNLMAVASYWHILGKNEAALMQHIFWGTLLLVTLCHGQGMLSLDHWLKKRWLAR